MNKNNNTPQPTDIHPIKLPDGQVWPYTMFLNNVIDHPRISIGDFTYYTDYDNAKDLARRLAPYLHPQSPEQLFIGRFVQIANGTQFITGGNHQMDGVSTFPFAIFGGNWAESFEPNYPNKGDMIIGHDTWIGHESTIMPGVNIGNGAIIGAKSVVTQDVPDYTVVAGNPAKIIRRRFTEADIERLNAIAWWDWPIEKVTANIKSIVSANIDQLERL